MSSKRPEWAHSTPSSILLVRHGPVALDAPGLLSRDAFLRYVEAYERADLRSDARPLDVLARNLAARAEIFASDAPRVSESLALLGLGREAVVDPLFGEESHSAPHLSGRWPLIVWFALSRGAGVFHPEEADARRKMRERAQRAAGLLTAAAKRGPVALVGHGWFNRAITRALAKRAWRRIEVHGGSAPWSHVVLELRQG